MSNNTNNDSSLVKLFIFIFGTIFGAALGLVMGLLFAPKTGDETRQAVIKAAAGAKDRALEKVRENREAGDKKEA